MNWLSRNGGLTINIASGTDWLSLQTGHGGSIVSLGPGGLFVEDPNLVSSIVGTIARWLVVHAGSEIADVAEVSLREMMTMTITEMITKSSIPGMVTELVTDEMPLQLEAFEESMPGQVDKLLDDKLPDKLMNALRAVLKSNLDSDEAEKLFAQIERKT